MLQAEKLLPDELQFGLRFELWLELSSLLPVELQHLLCTAPDLLRSGSDLLRTGPELLCSGSGDGNRSGGPGSCRGTGTGAQRLT